MTAPHQIQGHDILSSSSSQPMPSPPTSPQTRRFQAIPRRASSTPNFYIPSRAESIDERSSISSSSRPPRGWRSLDAHSSNSRTLPPIRSEGDVPSLTPPVPPAPTARPRDDLQVLEQAVRRIEEVLSTLSRRERRASPLTIRGMWNAARGLFGYGPEGTAARRDTMSLAGKMIFGIVQIAATITLLAIAGQTQSPTVPNTNEWDACSRPLGIWCSIWCVRVVLGCLMAIWGYRRRAARLAELQPAEPSEGDVETTDRPPPGVPADQPNQEPESVPTNHVPHSRVSQANITRVSSLLSLVSVTWFITAHILLYTSTHSCRLSSPHLWWLTFGIICIGYLVILELVFVAFLVFILGPLVFLLINLILICMGRHPLRTPYQINHEIAKLPQKAVDRIPLVLYIPAPTSKDAPHEESQEAVAPPLSTPEPAHVHSYPPDQERPAMPSRTSSQDTQGTRVRSRSRRWFTFRRIRLKRNKGETEKGKAKQPGDTGEGEGSDYENKWEKGEYPFVKLENNRAACAICLCDFEEPRRVRYSLDSKPPEDLDEEEKGVGGDNAVDSETDGELRLADAGDGAQPLRLLACAHVFHKKCLDPWLTEVSGRCPVCQRPVEVQGESTSKRTSRRR